MTLSELTATSEYASETRYRDPRAPQDRLGRPEDTSSLDRPAAEDFGDVSDAVFYGRRFKTDLSQLKAFDGAQAPSPDAEGDSALIDFFGHLSVLLVAVRAGDITRAQSAADALELDALVERNGGRRSGGSAAMLGDLVALLGAAQSRNEGAARLAARDLAGDFALAPAPRTPREPYRGSAEDGGAAYETLAHYLDDE